MCRVVHMHVSLTINVYTINTDVPRFRPHPRDKNIVKIVAPEEQNSDCFVFI